MISQTAFRDSFAKRLDLEIKQKSQVIEVMERQNQQSEENIFSLEEQIKEMKRLQIGLIEEL